MEAELAYNQGNGKHVGNLKISKGKKALTIHMFNEDRYLSIPLVEIEALMYENMHGISNRIAPVIEYPLLTTVEIKKGKEKGAKNA